MSIDSSVVNGFPVCRFVLVEKTKSTKNIWEPVFENVIILGFLRADFLMAFIKTTKNIHILLNMPHFYYILTKVLFTYFLVSRESHFQLQVLVHVRPSRNNLCQYQAYEVPDFVHFKATVTRL